MLRLLRASLCATLLFACVSIGSAADEKLPQSTPFYPLQVGSSWQYKTNDKEGTKVVLKVTGIESSMTPLVPRSSGSWAARKCGTN